MIHETICHWLITIPSRTFNHLQPGMGLILRCWVAWQFLKSGWLKVDSWDTTLFLFAEE